MQLAAVSWEIGLSIGVAISFALVVAAELASGGAFKIFGPVLFYEMMRAGRRGRVFLLRSCYALFIFMLLFWIWSNMRPAAMARIDQTRELAKLAEVFFFTFAAFQFCFVVLLTPGYVAGCIADDKERRTLEFLLATDLGNREIVFGKLVARVGNLLLFLLTGMPVLSLIQFFGGIDPAILLMTFAATGLTMLGLVGISVMQSVLRRRVRDAIIVTFVVAIAYETVCMLLWMAIGFAGTPAGRATVFGEIFLAAAPWLEVFRWGEPIRTLGEVTKAVATPGQLGQALLHILGEYAAFHLTVFVLGVGYAVWRLRKIALRQAGGGDGPKKNRKLRKTRRPAIWDRRPMHWKEIFIDGRLRLGPLAQVLKFLLIALAFAPPGIMVYLLVDPTYGRMSWSDFREGIAIWVCTLNSMVGCLILIGIGIRAAGSVGGERDKDTMVSLLTTPLTAREILFGKFWGAISSVRGLAIWLAIIWLIGLTSTSIGWQVLPFELLGLLLPAVAAAWIGLFYSVVCPTTLRAVMFTLGTLVICLGGHWVFGGLCCYAPLGLSGINSGAEYIVSFELGMTPVVTLAVIPKLADRDWSIQFVYLMIAFLGNFTWLLVAGAVGLATYDRFVHLTNRAHKPGRPPAPGQEDPQSQRG